MLVLSTRPNEKVLLPDFGTSIEVVAIQAGMVRLGISSPGEVRVVRQGATDRVAEWEPEDQPATLPNLKRLIDKRLEIARGGINEARQCLRAGRDEDARVLLEKIDEDLHLLRRRVRREIEKTEDSPCGMGI
jgi:sRNA-binding carbon storage regulator CsrA